MEEEDKADTIHRNFLASGNKMWCICPIPEVIAINQVFLNIFAKMETTLGWNVLDSSYKQKLGELTEFCSDDMDLTENLNDDILLINHAMIILYTTNEFMFPDDDETPIDQSQIIAVCSIIQNVGVGLYLSNICRNKNILSGGGATCMVEFFIILEKISQHYAESVRLDLFSLADKFYQTKLGRFNMTPINSTDKTHFIVIGQPRMSRMVSHPVKKKPTIVKTPLSSQKKRKNAKGITKRRKKHKTKHKTYRTRRLLK